MERRLSDFECIFTKGVYKQRIVTWKGGCMVEYNLLKVYTNRGEMGDCMVEYTFAENICKQRIGVTHSKIKKKICHHGNLMSSLLYMYEFFITQRSNCSSTIYTASSTASA